MSDYFVIKIYFILSYFILFEIGSLCSPGTVYNKFALNSSPASASALGHWARH